MIKVLTEFWKKNENRLPTEKECARWGEIRRICAIWKIEKSLVSKGKCGDRLLGDVER
jgi:hypothetical protein